MRASPKSHRGGRHGKGDQRDGRPWKTVGRQDHLHSAEGAIGPCPRRQDQPGYLGDDRFVMFLGDNVIQGGISGLIREFETSQYNCQIVLTAVDNPSSYGVAELDPETRRIIRLVEKAAQTPPSNLALVGSICSTSMSGKP